jgi:hypothetical protein
VPRQTKGIPKKLSLSKGYFLSTFPWSSITLSLYPPILNDDEERERGGERDEKKPSDTRNKALLNTTIITLSLKPNKRVKLISETNTQVWELLNDPRALTAPALNMNWW